MPDQKACWLKTAHEPHTWDEPYPGKPSLELQHRCSGVDNFALEALGKLAYLRRDGDWGTVYKVSETWNEELDLNPPRVTITRVERMVTMSEVVERTVTETNWSRIQQLNCWCCTCPSDGGNDAYCRNHNMGFGARPCDIHGVQGEYIVDFVGPDVVEVQSDRYPEPVSVIRAKQAEALRDPDLWRG